MAENNYVDVSKLTKLRQISDFRKSQHDFLAHVKNETKLEPIIVTGHQTVIHELVLERALRYWGLDEKKVIDKFVLPQYREIISYTHNNLEVLLHIGTKYINASMICNSYALNVKHWAVLTDVVKLCEFHDVKNKKDFKQFGLGLHIFAM